MRSILRSLLSADAESYVEAAGLPFDVLTDFGARPLVLFGAGQMGRAVHAALRDRPVKVICFADNSSTRWGQTLSGLPILSPAEAARRYGADAVFVFTFQADAQVLLLEEARLADLGVRKVCPFPLLLCKWPDTCGWPCEDPASFREMAAALEAVLNLFEDETSRAQFLGHLRWRMNRDYGALPVGTYKDQYFCPELIRLQQDECLVDGGAFDGDTIRPFLRECREAFARVHAFEPDPRSYSALLAYLAGLPIDVRQRITAYEAALGDSTGLVRFLAKGDHLSVVGEGDTSVRTLSVDGLSQDVPVTFIKLDLEGSERPALAGARETIIRDRPILAVAVYHHPSDLIELPLLLQKQCPDYRFHLRTHNHFGLDVVLYAIPKERTH